jgi:hypothetical protein
MELTNEVLDKDIRVQIDYKTIKPERPALGTSFLNILKTQNRIETSVIRRVSLRLCLEYLKPQKGKPEDQPLDNFYSDCEKSTEIKEFWTHSVLQEYFDHLKPRKEPIRTRTLPSTSFNPY